MADTQPRASRRRRSGESVRSAPVSPGTLARRVSRELAELVGREAEAVVSLERTDSGWCVGVEVLETSRIPQTADILAEYTVDVDGSGRLLGYHRTRRYTRGRTQEQM